MSTQSVPQSVHGASLGVANLLQSIGDRGHDLNRLIAVLELGRRRCAKCLESRVDVLQPIDLTVAAGEEPRVAFHEEPA
ncbi:MAG: hypothetical protein ACOC3H_02355, partial [bacterium]